MSQAIIDLGLLPAGAASILLEYRKKGERATLKLGETASRVSTWEVNGGSVEIMATVRDSNGTLHRDGTTTTRWETEEAVGAVPLPTDVATFPAPKVVQDGPALSVTPDVAPGLDPDEYEMEVRQSESGGAPKDSLQIGFVPPGQPIICHAWPTTTGLQELHCRAHRIEDGRLGYWMSTIHDAPLPILAPASGHSNDFAAGTLVATDAGVVPLEISGGDLRQKAIYAGDLDGATVYAGDVTDIYAGDAGLYWSPAKYITAAVTVTPAEMLQFQAYPDLTSIGRKATLYAGDCHWPAKMARFQIDGTYHDPRPIEASLQNGADETPTVATVEVTTNAVVYEDLIPGKVYANVTSYSVRWTFKTFQEKRLTIDNLHVRHWVYCRSRPWHTHSDAAELIYENHLEAAATNIDATIAGDDWDDIYIHVQWKNAHANTCSLWLRPNNDSGNNYDHDGAPFSEVLVGQGGQKVAQHEWEDAHIHLHRAQSGAERAFTVEQNPRWTTTTSDSSSTPETYLWTNTADEITTIRFTTSNGDEAFAIGTHIHIYGKRSSL